jgi:hypothetical protein
MLGGEAAGPLTGALPARTVVRQSGAVAVFLGNVPPERAAELVAAAASAFR